MTDFSQFAAAVAALDAAFVRHANAGEVNQLVDACYADDALVLPPNLPLVRGRGQVRELFRELVEAGVGDVERETLPLHVAGDLGYGVGRYAVATGPPGKERVRETGKGLLVYRRQADGSWKVAADMFSSDVPPAGRPTGPQATGDAPAARSSGHQRPDASTAGPLGSPYNGSVPVENAGRVAGLIESEEEAVTPFLLQRVPVRQRLPARLRGHDRPGRHPAVPAAIRHRLG